RWPSRDVGRGRPGSRGVSFWDVRFSRAQQVAVSVAAGWAGCLPADRPARVAPSAARGRAWEEAPSVPGTIFWLSAVTATAERCPAELAWVGPQAWVEWGCLWQEGEEPVCQSVPRPLQACPPSVRCLQEASELRWRRIPVRRPVSGLGPVRDSWRVPQASPS